MKMAISEEQRRRLERLAGRPDEEIDTSDIAEVLDWSGAVRSGRARAGKEVLTLQVDADVLAWFREHASSGEGYAAEINRVLRKHVAEKAREDR
jgi:uncharacterized protein (DUF4415 family)